MKKYIVYGYVFVLLLASYAPSYAIDFIKFGTGHDEDFWGTPNSEFGSFPSTVQYLASRGKNEVTSINLTDENAQSVFSGELGPFDALVVSESINDELSEETYALFDQYVRGGGCLIVTGSHGDEEDFLNNAFGYNVTSEQTDDGVDTFLLQAGVTGTQFEGGPNELTAANATLAFSNTPGITIYSGSTGVVVFTDSLGQGLLTAIGWDYCCTPPDRRNQILAWYDVVNRAFNVCFPDLATPPAATIPTLSEWGLISMAGIMGIVGLFVAMRRRKAEA